MRIAVFCAVVACSGAKPVATTPEPAARPAAETVTVSTKRIEIPRKHHPVIVLELPVVHGLGDPAVEATMNAALSAEKILGQPVDEVRADASRANPDDVPSGVQGARFSAPYNDHGLLEIVAFTELFGAYPSVSRFHVLLDVRTGAVVGADAFVAAKTPALVAKLESMRAAETKAAAAKEPELNHFTDGMHFELKDLGDFSPRPDGLTFNFRYDFPHVAKALEPPGRYTLPWSVVGAFIEPSSALARALP